MCGIFGVVGEAAAAVRGEATEAALQALHHRGPEARGLSRGTGALFGHTRLRIIDLSEAGAQPMRSADGLVHVTFNGEIYNHKQLRTELSSRGHRFRSRCDTEVLVYGYLEWGEDLPQHLDGMFAFGVWDERRRRVLLARDRAGEKPLFYHYDQRHGALYFASEIKALFPLGTPLRVRHQELGMLLSFGYVPAPATLYHGIEQLPPATQLSLDAGGVPRLRSYWQPAFASPPRATLSTETREQVREQVVEAVRSRLEADVPLGAFLSGGIDSSIVVGVMARVLERRVKTFSIGFRGDARFDETHFARMAAEAFGTEHTEFVIDPRTLDLGTMINELVWLHDGPFGDSSAIPTYIVSRLTREHVTVALTGDGGDELFCGYPRFIAAEAAEYAPPPLVHVLWRLFGLARVLPRRASERSLFDRACRFLGAAALPLPERVARWNSLFLADLPRMARPEWRAELDTAVPLSWQRAVFSSLQDAGPLGQILQHNFLTYLPYDLLVKVDRTAMAHALETRSPFLAPDLIDFAARLPASYMRRGLRMKHVLREAFADLLPAPIRQRGKMGFGMPLGTWFRGDLRGYLLDHLSPSARLHQYLEPQVLRGYLDEHLSGTVDHSHRLWTLLTLEVWLKSLSKWQAPCA